MKHPVKIALISLLSIIVIPTALVTMNLLYKILLYQGLHLLPYQWRIK